jgi:hypothetical protein
MAKVKYDGIVEAVHYNPDGTVKWARAYLRRGQIYSDIILLDRQILAGMLKSGKRFMIGRRIPLQASTFEVFKPLRLVQRDGQEFIMTSEAMVNKYLLEGAPVV